MLSADLVWPLRGADAGIFSLQDDAAPVEQAIVTSVERPVLLGFVPDTSNGRAMLVLGGGGYTALMVSREGIQIAHWLRGLGYHAFVLVHRFPDARNGPSAPLDDALEAVRMIRNGAYGISEVGVVGLSSGGHLAACLAADYPAEWGGVAAQKPDVLIVGYAPISTNAKGRQIVPDKPPLPPVEKQAMYDRLLPDAQLLPDPPPTFIVYAENDPVVPVENALRLRQAVVSAGGAAEMHLFADAPHGFAMDTKGLPVSSWPTLCEAWLRQIGFL